MSTDLVTAGQSPLAFLKQLAADLSNGPVELPCFPTVVIKIRDALNNPKSSPETIARVVSAEPLFAARLLQTANSAAFNTSGKRIAELRAAITRLGQQLVQSAALSFAVQQMRNAPSLQSIAKPLGELWSESITVACLCQVIARRTKVMPEEAFLAGLMHGIGRLYIMAKAVGTSAQTQSGAYFDEIVTGWHPSIAKAVLENWESSDEICEAVASQTDHERTVRGSADLTDVLIVSILLAGLLATQSRAVDVSVATAFARIGLSSADCLASMTHAECSVGSLQEALGC